MTEEVYSNLTPVPYTKSTRAKVMALMDKLFSCAEIRFHKVKGAGGAHAIGFHADAEVTWEDPEGPIDGFLFELQKYLEDGQVVTYTETRIRTGAFLDNGKPAPTVVTTFIWMASRYAIAGYTLDDLVHRAIRTLPKTRESWERRKKTWRRR